jgi:hypothetical protein
MASTAQLSRAEQTGILSVLHQKGAEALDALRRPTSLQVLLGIAKMLGSFLKGRGERRKRLPPSVYARSDGSSRSLRHSEWRPEGFRAPGRLLLRVPFDDRLKRWVVLMRELAEIGIKAELLDRQGEVVVAARL